MEKKNFNILASRVKYCIAINHSEIYYEMLFVESTVTNMLTQRIKFDVNQ